MLGIVLKILSIVGIVLLAGLGLVLVFLLLLLFFPFTYRVLGSKDENGLRLTARVNWLFGLFRVRFCYPEPGHLTAKVLCFSLLDAPFPFDLKTSPDREVEEEQPKTGPTFPFGKGHSAKKDSVAVPEERDSGTAATADGRSGAGDIAATTAAAEESPEKENQTGVNEEKTFLGKISQKIRKIKYTIYNIYDKIKEIWENISYYISLLQEENTKQLLSHVLCRAGSILKGIRPRRMKVRLLFGMDSPDTTGYLYGAYCVLSAALGPGFLVTPDFEQKRLEGEFDIAGHITVWIFVVNGLKLILDKKLHLFLKKVKAGRQRKEKKTEQVNGAA